MDTDFNKVAEMCGGSTRRSVIEKEIEAYRHMQEWKDLDTLDRFEYSPQHFQKFFQYQIRKKRLSDIGLDEKEFLEHVSKNRVYRAADVRQLDKIWENPEIDPKQICKQIFIEEDSRAAFEKYKELERRQNVQNSNNIMNLASSLISEINKLDDIDREQFLNDNSECFNVLNELKISLNEFVDDLEDIYKNLPADN